MKYALSLYYKSCFASGRGRKGVGMRGTGDGMEGLIVLPGCVQACECMQRKVQKTYSHSVRAYLNALYRASRFVQVNSYILSVSSQKRCL